MPESPVRWVSAFLDVPADRLEETGSFWCAVTGSTSGPATGDRGEFLPLEPPTGHPCLWLQRIDRGSVACHPDLYVDDVEAFADHAVRLGAFRTSTTEGLTVLRSPGGMAFCVVQHRDQSTRPGPVGRAGARSIVDQICLDIPGRSFERECDFWSALTGWVRRDVSRAEFARLARPPAIPYAFLLQRLDDEQDAVGAHLDLACEDRDAVTRLHESYGAEVVRRTQEWTVLRDPSGTVYCNTDRRPGAV